MTRRERRRFGADLKARVALAALREDKTLAELTAEHQAHPNQIRDWRKQLLDTLPEVFAGRLSAPSFRR